MDAANILAELLKQNGEKEVVVFDLARGDWAEAVANAFKYSNLGRLKERNYQKRTVGIIENGSWAPSAGKCMKNILGEMKDLNIVEPMITIKSRMKEENMEQMKELAKTLV